MNRTKIEWTDFTWNIITGCLGPLGTLSLPGRCPYCYAHRLARGRLKKLYLSNPNIIPDGDISDPFTPRFWPSRLDEPCKHRKPSKIFVSSMGEVFGNYISYIWILNILKICRECRQHTFQMLTKNPQKAIALAFPDNVWLGVTITSRRDWFRLPILLRSNAKVKFISFEPLLWNVFRDEDLPVFCGFQYVDWIIIGAQTQPVHIPPSPWVYRIIDSARKEGIPIFLKDNLHWPEKIQEFPRRSKVEDSPQNSGRILTKSGEVSQAKDHKTKQPK